MENKIGYIITTILAVKHAAEIFAPFQFKYWGYVEYHFYLCLFKNFYFYNALCFNIRYYLYIFIIYIYIQQQEQNLYQILYIQISLRMKPTDEPAAWTTANSQQLLYNFCRIKIDSIHFKYLSLSPLGPKILDNNVIDNVDNMRLDF